MDNVHILSIQLHCCKSYICQNALVKTCLPHLTSGAELEQEHPVLDVLSGMNQGGQTSWAVACAVKLSSRRSREGQVAFITLTF